MNGQPESEVCPHCCCQVWGTPQFCTWCGSRLRSVKPISTLNKIGIAILALSVVPYGLAGTCFLLSGPSYPQNYLVSLCFFCIVAICVYGIRKLRKR